MMKHKFQVGDRITSLIGNDESITRVTANHAYTAWGVKYPRIATISEDGTILNSFGVKLSQRRNHETQDSN